MEYEDIGHSILAGMKYQFLHRKKYAGVGLHCHSNLGVVGVSCAVTKAVPIFTHIFTFPRPMCPARAT